MGSSINLIGVDIQIDSSIVIDDCKYIVLLTYKKDSNGFIIESTPVDYLVIGKIKKDAPEVELIPLLNRLCDSNKKLGKREFKHGGFDFSEKLLKTDVAKEMLLTTEGYDLLSGKFVLTNYNIHKSISELNLEFSIKNNDLKICSKRENIANTFKNSEDKFYSLSDLHANYTFNGNDFKNMTQENLLKYIGNVIVQLKMKKFFSNDESNDEFKKYRFPVIRNPEYCELYHKSWDKGDFLLRYFVENYKYSWFNPKEIVQKNEKEMLKFIGENLKAMSIVFEGNQDFREKVKSNYKSNYDLCLNYLVSTYVDYWFNPNEILAMNFKEAYEFISSNKMKLNLMAKYEGYSRNQEGKDLSDRDLIFYIDYRATLKAKDMEEQQRRK